MFFAVVYNYIYYQETKKSSPHKKKKDSEKTELKEKVKPKTVCLLNTYYDFFQHKNRTKFFSLLNCLI